MRPLFSWALPILCAAVALNTGCASSPSGSTTSEQADPRELDPAPTTPSGAATPTRPGRRAPDDESLGDIPLDPPSSLNASDARAEITANDAGTQATALSDGSIDASDTGTAGRCARGSRTLSGIPVGGLVGYSVLTDERFIFWQNALTSSGAPLRHDILALPRATLHDPQLAVVPLTIAHEDYALGELVSGDDGFLYFSAMPRADSANQGLFRVAKRTNAALESLPLHGDAEDVWPGQLAIDESYFYLASIGDGSRTLRIVSVSRANYQREELWVDTSVNNDSNAVGAMALSQADIALDRDHVYFSARINRNGALHEYRIYRLNKQGRRQTPLLLTTIVDTLGGLASDGQHLFFSDGGRLVQLDLASQQRQTLEMEAGMSDLRYFDGILSWTPGAGASAENLRFFCL